MTEPLTQALTAADRCDRCGAQALHRETFAAGDLLFCGHHHRDYELAMLTRQPA